MELYEVNFRELFFCHVYDVIQTLSKQFVNDCRVFISNLISTKIININKET